MQFLCLPAEVRKEQRNTLRANKDIVTWRDSKEFQQGCDHHLAKTEFLSFFSNIHVKMIFTIDSRNCNTRFPSFHNSLSFFPAQVVFPAKPQLQRQWPDDPCQRARVSGLCQTAMRPSEVTSPSTCGRGWWRRWLLTLKF